jgi:hypothetical protein
MFFSALQNAMNINIILLTALGSLSGVIIGALPGLSVTMATALLVSMTFSWSMALGIATLIYSVRLPAMGVVYIFIASTIIFLLVTMLFLYKRFLWKIPVISVGAVLGIYYLFRYFLNVRLP